MEYPRNECHQTDRQRTAYQERSTASVRIRCPPTDECEGDQAEPQDDEP
jgi:hypothetical protein